MNRLYWCFVLLLLVINCSEPSGNSGFSYDLIPVEIEGKWGYIDKNGEYVINPQFTIAQLFKDDLAVVANEDSLLGYINNQGSYVIKPTFLWATNFSSGLAFVTHKNGFITCIDNKGKEQFTLKEAESASEFSEDLALVNVAGKFGFVNRIGKFIIKPQFDYAASFKDGLAIVGKNIGESDLDFPTMQYGFIDSRGQLKINLQFNSAESFSEGLATVSIGDNQFGVIDKKGKYIINPKYGYILPFKNGLAAFNLSQDGGSSNNRGFLDKKGNIVINPQYNESGNFNHSLAPAKANNVFGYIDDKSNYKINPQFENASDFFSTIAAVKIGQKIGFIDIDGKYIISPQFTKTFPSAFGELLEFNGFYRGNFDFVETDYYDSTKLLGQFFTRSNKMGVFGLNKNKRLKEVVEDRILNNIKLKNTTDEFIQIVAEENKSLSMLNEDIDSFSISYDYLVTAVVMNFRKSTETFLVTDAELSSVEIHIKLFNDAVQKEEAVAESFRKELMKRYRIKCIYDSNNKILKGSDSKNLKISFYFDSFENTF